MKKIQFSFKQKLAKANKITLPKKIFAQLFEQVNNYPKLKDYAQQAIVNQLIGKVFKNLPKFLEWLISHIP